MGNSAYFAPFRNQLENIIIYSMVKTIDADTEEERWVKGEPKVYAASVLQIDSENEWETNRDKTSITYQLRIFAPVDVNFQSKIIVRGQEFNLYKAPLISKQPANSRKIQTRLMVHTEGK